MAGNGPTTPGGFKQAINAKLAELNQLISDGYDQHSRASFEDALAAVKSAGITVYVVGIGGVAGISLKGERDGPVPFTFEACFK